MRRRDECKLRRPAAAPPLLDMRGAGSAVRRRVAPSAGASRKAWHLHEAPDP